MICCREEIVTDNCVGRVRGDARVLPSQQLDGAAGLISEIAIANTTRGNTPVNLVSGPDGT